MRGRFEQRLHRHRGEEADAERGRLRPPRLGWLPRATQASSLHIHSILPLHEEIH